MSVPIAPVLAALESELLKLGRFQRVNKHEPKNAPGGGYTAAIWLQSLEPLQSSGLAATSGRLEFTIRLYTNMLAEPADYIDQGLVEVVDLIMDAFTGDLDLGANVRAIDLLGQAGEPLQAQAGYLQQDSKLMRVVDITVPLLINDLWEQA